MTENEKKELSKELSNFIMSNVLKEASGQKLTDAIDLLFTVLINGLSGSIGTLLAGFDQNEHFEKLITDILNSFSQELNKNVFSAIEFIKSSTKQEN